MKNIKNIYISEEIYREKNYSGKFWMKILDFIGIKKTYSWWGGGKIWPEQDCQAFVKILYCVSRE